VIQNIYDLGVGSLIYPIRAAEILIHVRFTWFILFFNQLCLFQLGHEPLPLERAWLLGYGDAHFKPNILKYRKLSLKTLFD